MAWMFKGDGLKLWQEAYDKAGYNVKVFPVILCPPETSGWFAKEIKTPAKISRVSKCAFYGLGGSVIAKMGASATMLATGRNLPRPGKRRHRRGRILQPLCGRESGFLQGGEI